MEQIQEAITQVGRAIVASSKGIGLWHYVTPEMEQHQSRHAVNEKKARRRLLYRGLSQDRAGPKHQLFNYYAQICESKEVSKYTFALTNCTQALKEVSHRGGGGCGLVAAIDNLRLPQFIPRSLCSGRVS